MLLTLLILAVFSIGSWTVIFFKWAMLRASYRAADDFEERVWSEKDFATVQRYIDSYRMHTGMANIFRDGFNELTALEVQPGIKLHMIVEHVEHAIRSALFREIKRLESNLFMLATVGSTSPYIGLFGTVWGVISAINSMSELHQSSFLQAAPGIASALIATAMGLFAAIPAVIAYNRYLYDVEQLTARYQNFAGELFMMLRRQAEERVDAVEAAAT